MLSIIQCPTCKAIISCTTYSCPHCGHIINQDKIHLLKDEMEAKLFSVFRKTVFPIKTSKRNIQNQWRYWKPSIHNSCGQLYEQVHAIYETIPVLVDRSNLTGFFVEHILDTIYETTLVSCTCSNYNKDRVPCRHIYRLFSELISESPQNPEIVDINPHIVTKFYSLTREEQSHFIKQLRCLDNMSGIDTVSSKMLEREIEIGLFARSPSVDYSPFLSRNTRDELTALFNANGISGFQYGWTKSRLISWVISTHPDFLRAHFQDCVHISTSPEIFSWGNGIRASHDSYTYSHPSDWYDLCDLDSIDDFSPSTQLEDECGRKLQMSESVPRNVKKLITMAERLNDDGQQMLLDYADDLIASGIYGR